MAYKHTKASRQSTYGVHQANMCGACEGRASGRRWHSRGPHEMLSLQTGGSVISFVDPFPFFSLSLTLFLSPIPNFQVISYFSFISLFIFLIPLIVILFFFPFPLFLGPISCNFIYFFNISYLLPNLSFLFYFLIKKFLLPNPKIMSAEATILIKHEMKLPFPPLPVTLIPPLSPLPVTLIPLLSQSPSPPSPSPPPTRDHHSQIYFSLSRRSLMTRSFTLRCCCLAIHLDLR